MSFAKFIEEKYASPEDRHRVDAAEILEASYLLHDVITVKTAERLDFLGRIISEYLSKPDLIDDKIAHAIEIATDRVVDCMAENTGGIHAGLGHIGQIQDDADIYEPRLREKLSKNFSEQSHFMYSFSSFLNHNRDGEMTLSLWGEHVLERLAERQILQIMEMDSYVHRFKRAYPAYSGLK